MSVIFTIVLFLLMLIIITTVHEFGHFITAKAFNIYVSEFSIGMGKLLYSFKKGETTYSLRLLLIGGYCAIAGDNEGEENAIDDEEMANVPFERTLNGVSLPKKIVVMLAGIFMNLVLALLIVAGVYLSIGQTAVSPKPYIEQVTAGSPAEKAGIKANDLILEASFDNGYSIKPDTFSELSSFFLTYENGDVHLKIKRGEEIITTSLVPQYDVDEARYLIGIMSKTSEVIDLNIFNVWGVSFEYLFSLAKLIVITLAGLFRGVGFNNLSGPIGVYNVTSEAVSMGMSTYFLLVAMISLNIGLFNALPLPVLDGGRVVISIIEAIIGRPLPKKLLEGIMTLSIVLVILLMIMATSQDLFKLFK